MLKCRQCSQQIEEDAFGPGKVCPHCGKESAPRDIKEFHVFLTGSRPLDPWALARDAEDEYYLGIDYLETSLFIELSIGDISNPPYSNIHCASYRYTSADSVRRCGDKAIKRITAVPENVTVYLWTYVESVDSYLNLLFYSSLFLRFKEVYLIPCKGEDGWKSVDLLNRKRRITCDELRAMSAEFGEIQARGSEYRVGGDGNVIHLSYEELADVVLDAMPQKYRNIGAIYAEVREEIIKETGYVISFNAVKDVFWRLLVENRIKCEGIPSWWGSTHYKMFCESKFSLGKRGKLKCTYDEVANAVCDALEYGATLPLYDVVDDDAVLEFEDLNEKVYGKNAIMERLEIIGADLYYTKKAFLLCDILRKCRGDRYGIGIFTSCAKGDLSERYWVSVDLNNKKIRGIRVSKAEPFLFPVTDYQRELIKERS